MKRGKLGKSVEMCSFWDKPKKCKYSVIKKAAFGSLAT